MNPVDIILKKRRGEALSAEEIQAFVNGSVTGEFKDYQLAALLMAICLRGMSERETIDLTMAMACSGDVLDLSGIAGVKVDKHSTGGVGDTTSLILVPLVACCGAKVAKMSGRGLGHTGGTLDKLESIPGMCIDIDGQAFIDQVNRVGCAVVGQTGNLAPADKAVYALRDVTGTVDSLPLITSSILSKKIASGADVIVLDVKAGSGAIMPTLEQSVELAEWMVRIGCGTGRRFSALVTDMDQPLGQYIGNALEVKEAILVLSGMAGGKLKDVSLLLGAHMLVEAGLYPDIERAQAALDEKIQTGEGLRKLAEMIEAQGGDPLVVKDLSLLPQAARVFEVKAERSGYVTEMRTSLIGNAAKALGAGRERKEDLIDPAVGLIMRVRIGERIEAGGVLYELHAGEKSDVLAAKGLMAQAIVIGDTPVDPPPLVHRVVTQKDV